MPTDTLPSRSAILRFLPVVAWMAIIFMLSHQSAVPEVPGIASSLTSIAGHFTVYFVLVVLLWWTLGAFDISQRKRLLLAFAGAVLYGFSDEWHQSFVPGRDPSLLDNGVDAIGAATGLAAVHWLVQSDLLPDRWL